MLQSTEEAFDKIALAIEGEVGLARLLPVGLGRDHRQDVAVFERRHQRIGIIALVGNEGVGLDPLEQRLGLRNVGGLTRRQRKRDGIAESIDDGMDFGRQTTARAADGLVFADFFLAPALCWWARTMVASSIMNSLSASCASISKTRENTPLSHHLR